MRDNLRIYRTISDKLGWEARRGVEEAIEAIETDRPGINILMLPTGYGKTAVFYALVLGAVLRGDSYGGIYASPLRSLGDDVYDRWLRVAGSLGVDEELLGKISGLQHMYSHESIYLNKPVVYTTFDTLFLHIFKLPPSELRSIARNRSLGHSEVSRARLADSIVFLDEPHLSMSDYVSLSSLLAAITYLGRAGSTLILSTATMPSILMEKIIGAYLRLGGVGRGGVCRIIVLGEHLMENQPGGCNVINVVDEDFTEAGGRVHYGFIGEDNIIKTVIENEDKRTAVIMNTRRRAKTIYRRLLGETGNDRIILLHSTMTRDDRSRNEERARNLSRRGEPFILVSTQVIEAGFDVSFDTMITDPCPADSLIQRAGRVARWRGEKEGRVFIVKPSGDNYKPYSVEAVNRTITQLESSKYDLKSLHANDDMSGYLELLETVYGVKEYMDKLRLAEDEMIGNIQLVSTIQAVGTKASLYKFIEGKIIRSSRIYTLRVEGVNETLPAPAYLVEKLLKQGLITGAVDVMGRKVNIDKAVGPCLRGSRLDNACLFKQLIVNDIESFTIDKGVYERIAFEDL